MHRNEAQALGKLASEAAGGTRNGGRHRRRGRTRMTVTDSTSTCVGDDRKTEEQLPNEVRALSALAFDELRRFPGAIRDMHLGIAERAFRGVGPAARPVKLIHDTLSSRAYGAIEAGFSGLGRAADTAMEQRHIGEQVALSTTQTGSFGLAVLSGLIGDRLERDGSALHQPASVRVQGERVGLNESSLRDAFPQATSRLAVFIHGLTGDEFCWSWGQNAATNPDGEEAYGPLLAADLGYTPVYLRYNSGLHISENGRAVAALLQELVEAWPVRAQQVALVGHSMGGLVARSATHQAHEQDQRWVRHVRHIVSLGTPHMGAPLERAAHRAALALHKLPETRMLSSFLKKRSAGIRDLRYGSLVDEDWQGRDPEALRVAAVKEVPLLPWATHCFVSASVTRDPKHPLGRLLGDILVLVPSARGESKTRRIPFHDEHGHHVGGTHHLALLNHAEVYERLREWLATAPEAPARSA
jgi:pimeloyl-ACP methyl ester carboxylesterase